MLIMSTLSAMTANVNMQFPYLLNILSRISIERLHLIRNILRLVFR